MAFIVVSLFTVNSLSALSTPSDHLINSAHLAVASAFIFVIVVPQITSCREKEPSAFAENPVIETCPKSELFGCIVAVNFFFVK